MNKKDWEEQVYSSNMNSTAKIIALAVGTPSNWNTSKPVSQGMATVARKASVSRSTASKYVDAMVEQGWLTPKGKGLYNTTVYELTESTEPVTGILAINETERPAESLRNLRSGPPVADPIGNYKVVGGSGQLPTTSATKDDSVADDEDTSCRRENPQLPTPRTPVADAVDKNPRYNPYESNRQPKTVAPAPVVRDEYRVRIGPPTSPNVKRHPSILNFKEAVALVNQGTPKGLKHLENLLKDHRHTEETRQKARDLYRDTNWRMDKDDLGRAAAAHHHALPEPQVVPQPETKEVIDEW